MLRIRVMQPRMTMEQADLLDESVRRLPGVETVTVHERTCGVIIRYTGDRGELIRSLALFSYEKASQDIQLLSHSSRALNRELKGRGIGVTAVCPFWTRTAFFDRAIDPDREPVVKHYAAMYDPKDVVAQAWRDAKRGRDMSRFGAVARFQGVLAKLLPHSFVMSYWMRQQKLS